MNFTELVKAVQAGEITFNPCGHSINGGDEAEILIDNYNHMVANAAGAADGTWNQPKEPDFDKRMRELYQRDLVREIEVNGPWGIRDGQETCCFGCGKELRWVYDGSKVLKLRSYWDGDAKKRVLIPEGQGCEFANPKPTGGKIKVDSKLIFANFFACIPDTPKDEEYSREWSLNHLAGREKRTKFKADLNVAYGQMGNMSIDVLLAKDKKSIIITGAYSEEYDEPFDGYDKIGDLSLAVWRWEATDYNTLGKANHAELLKDMKERCMDVIEVDVPHGTWSFDHYYDTDPDARIYAKLKLEE